MLHLVGLTPRRAPFSDWLAQLERYLERHTTCTAQLSPQLVTTLRACYDVGLSPQEIARDLMEDRA